MAKNIERINRLKEMSTPEEIIVSITNKLPSIAKSLISQNIDLSSQINRNFFENPDDPYEHGPKWHQWGIITHTKMSIRAYDQEIPQYFDQWKVLDKFNLETSKKIDGLNRGQLLKIAILFHDLGKFSERKLNYDENNSISFLFKNHEIASGKIIRSPEFSEMLKEEYGLSVSQIEYISECAKLHFELGFMRDKAKKSNLGYTINFVNSDLFEKCLDEFCLQHPKMQMEMGLLFFVDSLAKTDVRIGARTDQEIESQNCIVEKLLKKRKLDSNLIESIKQLPINILVIEKYLKRWANIK